MSFGHFDSLCPPELPADARLLPETASIGETDFKPPRRRGDLTEAGHLLKCWHGHGLQVLPDDGRKAFRRDAGAWDLYAILFWDRKRDTFARDADLPSGWLRDLSAAAGELGQDDFVCQLPAPLLGHY